MGIQLTPASQNLCGRGIIRRVSVRAMNQNPRSDASALIRIKGRGVALEVLLRRKPLSWCSILQHADAIQAKLSRCMLIMLPQAEVGWRQRSNYLTKALQPLQAMFCRLSGILYELLSCHDCSTQVSTK